MPATDGGLLTSSLASCGIQKSLDEVDDFLRGVLAAPKGFDPDAWLDLIAPADANDLRERLKERLKELEKGTSDSAPGIGARLDSLRSKLSTYGLDGLIVPLTDEHRNEYIPEARQRLAWLTGFTGSAGTLVVLSDRAVVFVDGRYTVQAKQQLDPNLFERAHLIDTPPDKWLGQNL
ncbi:MAG: aminopeptidase P family N-terminal domain-containing protein, partial [Pseudomonadota bacterium]